MTAPTDRRFADALEKARREWAVADAAGRAEHAGCVADADAVVVPLFGSPHRVTHPGGEVLAGRPGESPEGGRREHPAVVLVLLHYLLHADGTPPAGSWASYRELPDGLFYAAAFAARAEQPLARAFAGPGGADDPGLTAFRAAARRAGGGALTLGDAGFSFNALPRLEVAAIVWAGDDEEPGQARVLFDAAAGHYLPAEDLAELGGMLARILTAPPG